VPLSVSKRYALSIRTQGSACRRRASSSLRRVSSFSASSSSRPGRKPLFTCSGLVVGHHFLLLWTSTRRGPVRSIRRRNRTGLHRRISSPLWRPPRGISSPLEHGAALRVDSADLALVAFPGAVPQLAVDPGHAGDEAVGLDGAHNGRPSGDRSVDLAIAGTAPPTGCPRHQARPESPPLPGAGIDPTTSPVAGSILSMRASAIW